MRPALFEMLCSTERWFLTDVSGQTIRPNFKGQAVQEFPLEITILCCVKSQNSEVSWVFLHRRHPVLQFTKTNCLNNLTWHITRAQILVTSQSKESVCGRSIAGIVGSNTAEGMDVCLLRILFVFRKMFLRRADHSSRGVLPGVAAKPQ